MIIFFNSNFFIALTTLTVGVVAFYLYKKQKGDRKRDAAKLILQEIRYAEQKIRKFREVKSYRLYDRLLPTSSWNDNVHLFIKDLKENQIDLIGDFYAKALYIDTLIATISRQKNDLPATPSGYSACAPPPVVPMAPTLQPSGEFPVFPPPAPQIGIEIVMPPVSQALLKDVSMNVEFIYNTPVVEKIRESSEKKWYQIF